MLASLGKMASAYGGARVVLAYEASSLGFGLHDEVVEAGRECYVLAPTRIARSSQQRRRKTDEKDARHILDLLRALVLAGNELPSVWIPDPQTRDDRERVRARLDLGTKRVSVKTQIQSLLKRHQLRNGFRSDPIHALKVLDPSKRPVAHPVQDDRLGAHAPNSRQRHQLGERCPIEINAHRDGDRTAAPPG